MNRFQFLVLVLAFSMMVIGVNTVVGGNARSYSFFIAPSINFAVSPEQFTDYYTSGFGGAAGLEFDLSPGWAMIGAVDLKLFNPAKGMIEDWWTEPDEYPDAQNIEITEGKLTAFTISILGKGSLKSEDSRVFPYVKGGFGLTIAGANDIIVTWDEPGFDERFMSEQGGADDATNISYILGIGLEILMGSGNSSFFIDLGLHMIDLEVVDNPAVVPINLGIKF